MRQGNADRLLLSCVWWPPLLPLTDSLIWVQGAQGVRRSNVTDGELHKDHVSRSPKTLSGIKRGNTLDFKITQRSLESAKCQPHSCYVLAPTKLPSQPEFTQHSSARNTSFQF